MWWQATSALATLLLAVPAVVIGVLAFRRSSHAEDVEGRVEAIEAEAAAHVSAASVGLEYLERALMTQQAEITRQEGEIGELRGQLRECRDERQSMVARIAELEGRMS